MTHRIFFLVVLLITSVAFAGEPINSNGGPAGPVTPPGRSANAFGAGVGAETTHGWGFATLGNATKNELDSRVYSSTGGWFTVPVTMPSGVAITMLELEACDITASAGISMWLLDCDGNGSCTYINGPSTGTSAEPGCTLWQTPLVSPITLDQGNRSYALEISPGAADGTTTIRAVRIYYKRQVSPGPLVATFADVPTSHGFFKFVEALAASGITGGCGGGNYCPNNPVTRGQLAVFLATALGLHWAP